MVILFVLFTLVYTQTTKQCPDKQYWQQSSTAGAQAPFTKGTCTECPTECATCWSTEKCTSCVEGYYINHEYKCLPRHKNDNCLNWDGLYCIECVDGYYIKDTLCDNGCKVQNCAKCNENKCFKCKGTLTLYEEKDADGKILSQSCIDCSDKNNDEKCGRCPIGKYFNTTFFTCENCRDDCDRCTNRENCYLCKENTALKDASDPYSPCQKLDRCLDGHYYGNHCDLCEPGFYVLDGYCSACGEYCSRCIDNTKCVECKNVTEGMKGKYTLTNGVCGYDEFCIIASDLAGCVECEEGYYLNDNGICTKCPDNCLSCLNPDYCFRCNENYYFSNHQEGKCEPMNAESCNVVDQYGCLQCKSDTNSSFVTDPSSKYYDEYMRFNEVNGPIFEEYFEFLEKEAEKATEEGSGDVEVVDRTLKFGFYLPYEAQKVGDDYEIVYEQECKLCDTACRMCEFNPTWCTGCNAGFQMKEADNETQALYSLHFGKMKNVTIHHCVKLEEKCKRTEMGYCIECKDEFFLKGIECLQCDKSCETCVSENYCQACLSNTTSDGNSLYWRPPSLSDKVGEEKGLCFSVSETQKVNGSLLHCKDGKISTNGCVEGCEDNFYLEDGDCLACPSRCFNCERLNYTGNDEVDFECTGCLNELEYLEEGKCISCDQIENCAFCDDGGCSECKDEYSLSTDRKECTKVDLAIVIPSVVVGLLIIIAIIVIVVWLVWRHRKKTLKEREKEIKPFKVSNEVEMALLSADNENFPLKTDTWRLDFGHAGSKVTIDTEYEQTIQIVNPTKKSYFFEILSGASHRYELKSEPLRYTLKPDYAIEVKFTIKMLCTAIVKDEIGIIAMDMDEEVKETAKLTVLIESDLSMKLDHTELKLQMPAIGEGAFGMVFKGSYRGQSCAVKKMKARNLTEEQEREFKHEVNMLIQYRHACVVNLVGACYTEGEIAIVTEFADYGSLSSIWKREQISYDLKIKFMEDAVVALSFLHENQIIHRDVKGENVLIYSLNPHSPVCGKLTDFGTCRNISERSLQSKELSEGIGTPTYMAPECLASMSYTFSADVYSFACMLYETYTEVMSYIEDERFNQPWMIPQFVIEGKRLERPEGMPDNYWNLIEICWSQEAEKRPTFPQIYATLSSWGNDIFHTEMNLKANPIDLPN